ncbi:monooxygenase [Aspergillus undulatus]|uniref:monooxygenase n=1 Tax=Aspergillus undulatus TaxID=1810928 RepID=UPI003CCD1F75
MEPLRVLICGGGISGPALAFWLARRGHRVVVIERFPALRTSGAQIDLRRGGIEVVRRMGLLETVRSKLVDEPGSSFVDSKNNVVGSIMANTSGKGAQSLTSEYEITRGNLVRILYDATKDKVEYAFGKTVERYEQDNTRVVAHFSDGSSDTYDLLVGADGQGSRVRESILPAGSNPYHRMGVLAAYWHMPRIGTDSNVRNSYLSPRGRLIMRRSPSPTETEVLFMLRGDPKELSSVPMASVDQQKAFWTQQFHDAGWQVSRFLKGMATAEDFYCHEMLQVRIDKWHRGRVVLVGDAAHCPSPLTGMGTSSSIVGAYVLAGAIDRHRADLSRAFAEYEASLRPFIDEAQSRSPGPLLRIALPYSQWGVATFNFIVRVICFLRLPDLIARFSSEDPGGWKLPNYPELYHK